LDFRKRYNTVRTGDKPPPLVQKDSRRMAEIESEDRLLAATQRTVILPKINKKE
jgi:hypothetical protein